MKNETVSSYSTAPSFLFTPPSQSHPTTKQSLGEKKKKEKRKKKKEKPRNHFRIQIQPPLVAAIQFDSDSEFRPSFLDRVSNVALSLSMRNNNLTANEIEALLFDFQVALSLSMRNSRK
ncbi:integrase-type DNA-binding superfamily protein [Striga asiatica]|uniref:Integrase-type DNA-binding superfamily protein n=1 Tax=Striga asiatica TaxID=4170 RepID=A0A5A7QM47_STRAF|nr:integrase-type DNA-binding superfamily protein [Striga asiatica]